MISECILAVYLGADRSRHFQESGIEFEGPAVAYLVLEPESLQASRRSVHRFHLAQPIAGRCRRAHRALVLSESFLQYVHLYLTDVIVLT